MNWFVQNARDAEWIDCRLGKFCDCQRDGERFPELGINLNLMQPGEPMTMYHCEPAQEDFLVLEGECLLIVEGEERTLKKWDLFHCHAGVAHAVVGAGDGPSLVLAVGSRTGEEGVFYPADPVAQKHAGVVEDTSSPKVAYAGIEFPKVPTSRGGSPTSAILAECGSCDDNPLQCPAPRTASPKNCEHLPRVPRSPSACA